jgi:hypothetical protein
VAAVAHDRGVPPRRGCAEGVAVVACGDSGEADVCDFDPGYEVASTIQSSLRTLTRIWRGDVDWSHALLDGSVAVSEPADVRRAILSWIGQATLAAVPRPA